MQENTAKSLFNNSIWVLLTFVTVFYGVDHLTTYRNVERSLSTSFELKIPYVEETFIIYFSAFLLPFLIPACVKSKSELRLWTYKMIVAIIVSGLIFLLFPAKNSFHDLDISRTKWVTHLASSVTGTYNMMPSLHVSLSFLIWSTCIKKASNMSKVLLTFWFCLLVISTVLTHQHHLLDIPTGLLLAMVINSYFDMKYSKVK